jgi:hypothetical protein
VTPRLPVREALTSSLYFLNEDFTIMVISYAAEHYNRTIQLGENHLLFTCLKWPTMWGIPYLSCRKIWRNLIQIIWLTSINNVGV